MNRRNFLGVLGAGAAVAAFNPHRVIFDMGRKLWTPAPWTLDGLYPVYAKDGGISGFYMILEHRSTSDITIVESRRTIFNPQNYAHLDLANKHFSPMKLEAKITCVMVS